MALPNVTQPILTNEFVKTKVNSFIRDAYMRCGMNLSLLSGQHLQRARFEFNCLLSSWMNHGLSLFTIQERMELIIENQTSYALATDVSQVLDVTLLNTTDCYNAGSTYSRSYYGGDSPADAYEIFAPYMGYDIPSFYLGAKGFVQVSYPVNTPVQYIGIMVGETKSLCLKVSACYETPEQGALLEDFIDILTIPEQKYIRGKMYWFALPWTESCRTWRIQSLTPVLDFVISHVSMAICQSRQAMGSTSRDKYMKYPTNQNTGMPTTYYFDRRFPNPVLNVWMIPTTQWQFFLYNVTCMMTDITLLTYPLQFPQRFFDMAIAQLAAKLASIYFPEKFEMLSAQADILAQQALSEDVTREPITFKRSGN